MKKTKSLFRPMLFSRHPSHWVFRPTFKILDRNPFKSVIRLGSTTEGITNYDVEINSVESIKTSSNKIKMKQAFSLAEVKTADWFIANNLSEMTDLAKELTKNYKFKLVVKHKYGSRGRGNTLITNEDQLIDFFYQRDICDYVFERYYPYLLEYRLHVTKNGCFYACRKGLKSDTSPEDRWRRHSDNSVFFLEENEEFKRPNSWDEMVEHCIKALTEIGADVLSFDIKVQGDSSKKQDFILLESNSASSFGEYDRNKLSKCAENYIKEINHLIKQKYNESRS